MTTELHVTEHGPHPDDKLIWITADHEGISMTLEIGLELAYLLMSICKGQGSGQTHTIPKDKDK